MVYIIVVLDHNNAIIYSLSSCSSTTALALYDQVRARLHFASENKIGGSLLLYIHGSVI